VKEKVFDASPFVELYREIQELAKDYLTTVRAVFGKTPRRGDYYEHRERDGVYVMVNGLIDNKFVDYRIVNRPVPGGVSVFSLPTVREFSAKFKAVSEKEALAILLMGIR
jgi:hypothetical protein